jgi:hypothetical protein
MTRNCTAQENTTIHGNAETTVGEQNANMLRWLGYGAAARVAGEYDDRGGGRFPTSGVSRDNRSGSESVLKSGDYVKVEFVKESTGESEWMWVEVSPGDSARRIVFGRLDSEPVVITDLHRGMELAVSYDNIRERRTSASFKPA